eukprot:1154981-Pelagomonas_calceolata.AAC.1
MVERLPISQARKGLNKAFIAYIGYGGCRDYSVSNNSVTSCSGCDCCGDYNVFFTAVMATIPPPLAIAASHLSPTGRGCNGCSGCSGYEVDDSEADRTARKKQKKEKKMMEQANTEPGHQQQDVNKKEKKAHKEGETSHKKKKKKSDRKE